MPTDSVGCSALGPLAPGRTLEVRNGSLSVEVAPFAGGRIAQIRYGDDDWLVGHGDGHEAMIAWGCYPMLPWAGRLRDARFEFAQHSYRLRPNLGSHAIHGLGFGMPWQVQEHSAARVELSLRLPEDARWPFGGSADHRIEVTTGRQLSMTLSMTAGAQAMPAAVGWHPWFRKPDRIGFSPDRAYSRDNEGIATLPLIAPPEGPWDDCFVNDSPVFLHRAGHTLQLTSDCRHWVAFDIPQHATCFEPQSGPPDTFNLSPARLEPGQSLVRWFQMEWQ